jgi:peptidoglycan hydrolase CwlO-like protein
MSEETFELLYRPPGKSEYQPVATSIDELYELIYQLQKEISELKQKINSEQN